MNLSLTKDSLKFTNIALTIDLPVKSK